ncbi:MAG: flavin reductase [Clostridiales bacterium]|nr:flavin reductase [Clostridiales bacterium]
MNNKAMYKLTYGLFVLTAQQDGKDNGCIVNTVQQVTTEPNRIIVAINKNNLTHDMVLNTGVFNVSVLSEDSKFATYKHWGMQSGKDVDKLLEISYSRSSNGLVYIADEQTNAYLSAKVVSATDLGTHTLFLADVTDAEVLSDTESATYSFYQSSIKVKPSEDAPKKGFVCTVCGYIYEGETLPPDFICPWCNHDASYFKPIE